MLTTYLAAPFLAAVAVSSPMTSSAESMTAVQDTSRSARRSGAADTIKRTLSRLGATIDETKSTPDMVVSQFGDPKGDKTTIVIINDRRKSLLGLYVYNFGNLKDIENREEIYRYLLATNDAITIGSFFVDGDEDIGYKYLFPSPDNLDQRAFESTYLTMAAVARERRNGIRKLLGSSGNKGN